MNIEERKRKIVKNYGIEPTICYFHYLWNAVDYIGEENLRKSFKSLVGQGDEVIVVDYDSTDNTKKIAKEYGFKVFNVEKEPNISLAESKLKNRVVKETKCNFTVQCDGHVEYPKNTTDIIINWLKKNDITKKMLVLRATWINEKGEFHREWGFGPAPVFYTPYLIEARGYDERCQMGYGGTHYDNSLALDVYKLEFDDVEVDGMIHKYHIPEKTKILNDVFKIYNMGKEKHMDSVKFGQGLARKLIKNFDEGVKNVKNSYW